MKEEKDESKIIREKVERKNERREIKLRKS